MLGGPNPGSCVFGPVRESSSRGRVYTFLGFPGVLVVKNLPANAGDASSIPGSGRSPEEGNGNPLQYSCLENSMDRGASRAAVRGVTKS